MNGAIQSFGQKFETLFLETSVESDGVTFGVSSVLVAGVIVEPRNKFYIEKNSYNSHGRGSSVGKAS